MRSTFFANPTIRSKRTGFTLVELLVVMGIMIVLSTLAVLIVPSVNDNRVTSRGADNVQGWMMFIKHRALRDNAPRGIRLLVEPAGATTVGKFQYVEQPDLLGPFPLGQNRAGSSFLVVPVVGDPSPIPGDPTNQTGTLVYVVGPRMLDTVQSGDFLEFGGISYKIEQILPYTTNGLPNIGPPSGPAPNVIWPPTLLLPQPYNGYNTFAVSRLHPIAGSTRVIREGGFNIVRQPRPLQGEPDLQLPKDVVIDLALSRISNTALTALVQSPAQIKWIDVMFAPSSQATVYVMQQFNNQFSYLPVQGGKVVLWVRHINQNPEPAEPTLMTIYTRSGSIVPHPRADGADPYANTRDGRGSGL